MTEAMRPEPLADIRVLEIGQALALPMCGLMLADMGAEVIKLEPLGGDASRALNQIFPGESKSFAIFNRGKRDVVIDVALPESRPAIEALVRHVDVVLVAMKPADLQRYGLTYEALQSVREDIVLLEQSGLGTAGPFGDQGSYDVVAQGLSGLAALMARDRGTHLNRFDRHTSTRRRESSERSAWSPHCAIVTEPEKGKRSRPHCSLAPSPWALTSSTGSRRPMRRSGRIWTTI